MLTARLRCLEMGYGKVDMNRKDSKLLERRARLYVWISLILIIILGSVTLLFLGKKAGIEVEQQMLNSLSRVCVQNARLVQGELDSRQKALRVVAARLGTQDRDKDIQEQLESLESCCRIFDFFNMGIFGTDGIGYTTAGDRLDLSDEDYMKAALRGEETITESRLSEDGTLNINIFVTPVFRDGEVVAVVTATYDSTVFLKMINVGSFEGQGQSVLLDAEGNAVCVPTGKESERLENLSAYISDHVRSHTDPGCTFHSFFYEDNKYAAYSVPMGDSGWYVFTFVPYSLIYNDARQMKQSIMAVLLLLYLCIILMSLVCMRTYQKLTKRLTAIAFHDELTHEYNYEYLKIYARSMKEEERQRSFLAAFDIDRFKFINMLHGTEMGDRLLKYILRVFRDTLPEDKVFKNEGDVFIAILTGADSQEIQRKIECYDHQLKERADGEDLCPFTISYGICRMDQGNELRQVYDSALLAKKEAKRSLEKKYKFFDRIEQEKLHSKEIEDAFDVALKRSEFKVWYQPKYDIRTGSVCGAEALVRWKPEHGPMRSPAEFIPVLEENGKIIELDEEVLRQVCRDLKEMEAQGLPGQKVSVNLSKVHLKRHNFVEQLNRIVMDSGIDRSLLAFEITESVACEDRNALNKVVVDLQKAGFKVDMDDYGTGSSTLTSLSGADFNTLKLDKSFIDHIGTEKMDIILHSTIQMAKNLSMELVAEGVETEDQVQFLLQNQCFVVQGYYYSKPLAKEDFWKLLEK